MKKILIVALVAAASVVMTGCQKEEQNSVATAAEAVKADADKAAKEAGKAADAAAKEVGKAADAAAKEAGKAADAAKKAAADAAK